MRKFAFILGFLLSTIALFGQCTLAGTIEVAPELDYQRAYFTSPPLCNTIGFGIVPQDVSEVYWYFYCNTTDTYEEIQATSKDTINFYAGDVIVTCKVKVFQMGVGVVYISPSMSIAINGLSTDCFELIDIDSDTSNTVIPPSNTPAIPNSAFVDSGKIYLSGTGTVNIIDWSTFAPISPIRFENEKQVVDLNLYGGSQYRAIVRFDNPYEEIDLGVVQLY